MPSNQTASDCFPLTRKQVIYLSDILMWSAAFICKVDQGMQDTGKNEFTYMKIISRPLWGNHEARIFRPMFIFSDSGETYTRAYFIKAYHLSESWRMYCTVRLKDIGREGKFHTALGSCRRCNNKSVNRMWSIFSATYNDNDLIVEIILINEFKNNILVIS